MMTTREISLQIIEQMRPALDFIQSRRDVSTLRATHKKPMCGLRTVRGISINLNAHIPKDLIWSAVDDALHGTGIKAERV